MDKLSRQVGNGLNYNYQCNCACDCDLRFTIYDYSPLLVGHLAVSNYPEGRRHARHANDGALVVGQLAQCRCHVDDVARLDWDSIWNSRVLWASALRRFAWSWQRYRDTARGYRTQRKSTHKKKETAALSSH